MSWNPGWSFPDPLVPTQQRSQGLARYMLSLLQDSTLDNAYITSKTQYYIPSQTH